MGDDALDGLVNVVTVFDRLPRIGSQSLGAQAHASALSIYVEDVYLHSLIGLKDIARMVYPAPREFCQADTGAPAPGPGSPGTASPPWTETEPSGSSRTVEHEARTERLLGNRIPGGGKGEPTSQASWGASESDARASQRLSSAGKAVVSEAKTSLIPELTAADSGRIRAIPIEPTVIGQVIRGKRIAAKSVATRPGTVEGMPEASAGVESSDIGKKGCTLPECQ